MNTRVYARVGFNRIDAHMSLGFHDACVGGGCIPPMQTERPFQRDELSNVYSGRIINNTEIIHFLWLMDYYKDEIVQKGRLLIPEITNGYSPTLVTELDRLFNRVSVKGRRVGVEPAYTYSIEIRSSKHREMVQDELQGDMHTDSTSSQIVALAFIHFTLGHEGKIEVQPTRMYQTPPIWKSVGRSLITLAHETPPRPEVPQEEVVFFARVVQIDNTIKLDESFRTHTLRAPHLGMGPVDRIDPNTLATIDEDTSYVQVSRIGAFEGVVTEIDGRVAHFFADV